MLEKGDGLQGGDRLKTEGGRDYQELFLEIGQVIEGFQIENLYGLELILDQLASLIDVAYACKNIYACVRQVRN